MTATPAAAVIADAVAAVIASRLQLDLHLAPDAARALAGRALADVARDGWTITARPTCPCTTDPNRNRT